MFFETTVSNNDFHPQDPSHYPKMILCESSDGSAAIFMVNHRIRSQNTKLCSSFSSIHIFLHNRNSATFRSHLLPLSRPPVSHSDTSSFRFPTACSSKKDSFPNTHVPILMSSSLAASKNVPNCGLIFLNLDYSVK